MPDLEQRLRVLLHERADAVHPALTGAAVRSAAQRRHSRVVLPLAAAAIVAVLAVTLTFVLDRGHSHPIQPGGGSTAPAVSTAPVVPRRSPTPTLTTARPTTPRAVRSSPTSVPSTALGPVGNLPPAVSAIGSPIGSPASSTPPR